MEESRLMMDAQLLDSFSRALSGSCRPNIAVSRLVSSHPVKQLWSTSSALHTARRCAAVISVLCRGDADPAPVTCICAFTPGLLGSILAVISLCA